MFWDYVEFALGSWPVLAGAIITVVTWSVPAGSKKTKIAITAIAATAVLADGYLRYKGDTEARRLRSTLINSSQPIGPLRLQRNPSVMIYGGNMLGQMRLNSKMPLVGIGAALPFKIRVDPEGWVLFKGQIAAPDGRVVADANENGIRLRAAGYDKNSDNCGFEIVDGDGAPVLQMSVDDATFRLVTVSYPESGVISICDDFGCDIDKLNAEYETRARSITPLFLYPSYEHPGQRATGKVMGPSCGSPPG